MAFEDKFRLSSHAVILNASNEVLLLKANYGNGSWGLPGGALEPGETIHEALHRECIEEIGDAVDIKYLSGVYYHSVYNSQTFIFRCELKNSGTIKLSEEHTEYKYSPVSELSKVQQRRIGDCINFEGQVFSDKF